MTRTPGDGASAGGNGWRADSLPFQLATFLGAGLLFLVQPLIAKQILPWFGGAPAVWSTCLLFFQAGLLAGYAYAHGSRHLGVRRQAYGHVALLALALLTLPVVASPGWKPASPTDPVLRVLGLLTVSVGVPYVMLAATAPLLQDWYRRVVPDRSPYRLYVLSNAGSLAALVVYPALLERFFAGRTLSLGWSATFILFMAACAWCAWLAGRSTPDGLEVAPIGPSRSRDLPSTRLDGILWVVLPACGSGLLLASTNQLCQNIAVVPLLWIVPLALYLLTYIASFAGWYFRKLWLPLFVVSVGGLAFVFHNAQSMPALAQGTALLVVLVTGCMVCHGELVRLVPDPRHLTRFYLALAAGGSLGGVFVALVAPLVFASYVEFPLLIMGTFVLVIAVLARDVAARRGLGPYALVWTGPIVASLVALFMVIRSADTPDTIARARDFYGVLTVMDDTSGYDAPFRELLNGRIVHGGQFTRGDASREATTYYARGSGIDLAIRYHPHRVQGQPLTVGVIGLGTGTIAALGRPGDEFRFFEIDPEVIDFARRYFTYLRDSPASVTVVPGDARLSLDREVAHEGSGRRYDILALDAFSGDSIPVHLLTREAFALYWRALVPDGVLAVHVSNRFVDLEPVVRGLAAERGLEVLPIVRHADSETAAFESLWLLVTANQSFAGRVRPFVRLTDDPARPFVWTDDFSSIVSVLK